MDRLLLHSLDLQSLQFLIQNLTHIHGQTLVDLLPQMGTEDLNERNLQGRDLAVHKDTSQIQLDLETNIDIGTIDRRRPPQRETTVRNLVQTGALSVGQFLVPKFELETM